MSNGVFKTQARNPVVEETNTFSLNFIGLFPGQIIMCN